MRYNLCYVLDTASGTYQQLKISVNYCTGKKTQFFGLGVEEIILVTSLFCSPILPRG